MHLRCRSFKIQSLVNNHSSSERLIHSLENIVFGNQLLILLVEKQAHKVPQCIDKLAQVGLKIWVLTRAQIETPINIGFSWLVQVFMQLVSARNEANMYINECGHVFFFFERQI
ncbi:hypothetical protein SSX86_002151 [Deinandra increscens subsp. villosa]|uniref:Uncharacterized protein n=1 Tax=Deinandra increscens subsp. villosa TaxID=3103831 RepID=A0AAP0DNH4_9ASTR